MKDNSYQLATIAAILCNFEELRRSQLPLPTRFLHPEMFLGAAMELVHKAEEHIAKDEFKSSGT